MVGKKKFEVGQYSREKFKSQIYRIQDFEQFQKQPIQIAILIYHEDVDVAPYYKNIDLLCFPKNKNDK